MSFLKYGLTWLLVTYCSESLGYPAKQPFVEFESPEGQSRLESSQYKTPFELLKKSFFSQSAYLCGPTSSVIIMNSLTQSNEANLDNFFTEKTDQIKTRSEIEGGPWRGDGKSHPGVSLMQLEKLLRAHDLKSIQRIVANDDLSDEQILSDLKLNLDKKDTYLIAGVWRPAFGEKGKGHFSPIGAYDQKSNSFLFMDVNSKKPWIWVPSTNLIHSMRHNGNITRGYLVVSKS